VLSHPASVDTIPTSANVEDHVSMGCTVALKARAILDNVERMLALELMAAAQGIDLRKQAMGAQTRLGQGTGAAYDLVRGLVAFIDADTVLYPYMEALYRVVADGSLVTAVNSAMHTVDTQENVL
jgi:histidine ammonia-lyase